ncbi:hypothetical protein GGR53DRAFT_154196 [Hypoxylon sp. FL1150]|nr:hypothetical protein GGR53DRAFT_154196 [Hypoxylon sp. FL1150]
MAWPLPTWSLSRWLLFGRLLQILGSLVTAVMNGFLLVYILQNRLGLAESMTALELMACFTFIYSAVVLLVQHTGSRRMRPSTPVIAAFVVGDVVFNGVAVATITVLACTGLPLDCHGLTRSNYDSTDAPNKPPEGYQTIRFGNDDDGTRGLLDKFCALEKGFYIIAVGLVFTYMLTAALGALRIFERHWNEKGRLDPLFPSTNNIYELSHMGSKIISPNTSRDVATTSSEGIPSEGIITPSSRTAPTLQTQGVISSEDLRRERTFQERAQTDAAPVSPVSAASPTSQVSPISPVIPQRRSLMADPDVLDASMGGLMAMPSPDPGEEAAISDGYRPQQYPGMPSLPPYSPGSSRSYIMEGHGDESNEMRVSDYIKGESRAQNMKDSGMGL